jgi:hypothetical protein
LAVKKRNGAPRKSNGGSDDSPADLVETDVLPDWARRMIDQERDSVSQALLLARDEFELEDDDLVVMLADMTSEFGAEMALAYHGDEDRLADDVHEAEVTGSIPVLVNVMPPPAWRAFFGEYAPVALRVMEEDRPSNTVALAVVASEGVVVAFAERTLRTVGPWGLH